MKSNLSLALLLCLSFVGIYYFIEEPERQAWQDKVKYLSALNDNVELLRVENNELKWHRKGEKWFDTKNDMPLDNNLISCLLYTSPSPRDQRGSRMPSSA